MIFWKIYLNFTYFVYFLRNPRRNSEPSTRNTLVFKTLNFQFFWGWESTFAFPGSGFRLRIRLQWDNRKAGNRILRAILILLPAVWVEHAASPECPGHDGRLGEPLLWRHSFTLHEKNSAGKGEKFKTTYYVLQNKNKFNTSKCQVLFQELGPPDRSSDI